MNYIIQTPSARRLKEEIQKCVESKADGNGSGIVNWHCVDIDGGDKALVLTEGQWAEKGCITLTQVTGRNELQVRNDGGVKRFHHLPASLDRNGKNK